MKWAHDLEYQVDQSTFRPALLKMLRESSGYTQQELGAGLGFAQGTISKFENGGLVPSPDQLASLAAVFEVTEEFFSRTENLAGVGPGQIYHRKRVTGLKALAQLHARMNLMSLVLTDLLSLVESDSQPVPRVLEFEFDEIPEIAATVRRYLRIPDGPIESVSEALFSLGVILVPFDFGESRIDGVSWLRDESAPIVFYDPRVPDDRLRFTLMHEIGHLVLHCGLNLELDAKRIEEEANYFASCFLMPPIEISPSLAGLSINKLGRLKQYWKTSMQSILYIAKHHGSISDWRQRELWSEMTRLGYRVKEPSRYDFHVETPDRALQDLLNVYKNELKFTGADLQRLTKVNASRLEEMFGPNLVSMDSRIIQFPTQ